jgi:predicted RecB family nuclease
MYDTPEKHWISFSDLYPCIIKDPLQIYLKKHLNFPDIPYSNTTREKKEEYFKRNQLFYVSDKPSKTRYKFFVEKLANKETDFYSVPIYNDRYKWRSLIDMIVRKKYFGGDSDEYVITLLTDSKTITEYRRYQAHFYAMMLNHNKDIDTSVVCIVNIENNSVQYVSINDKNIQRDIVKYCKWIRNCINYGHVYTLNPPSHENLYPNMKVICNDRKYDEYKKGLAESINEITLMYRCHPKHRDIMHRRGVYSYLDTKFDVSLLKLPKKYEFIVKKMIEMKKDSGARVYKGCDNLFMDTKTECYIDFETLNDIIYWIGIGIVEDGKEYKYISYVSNSPTMEEQYRIMKETKDFLSTFHEKQVYYWYAEQRFWEKVKDDRLQMDFTDWVDMCKMFQDTPIIVKGAFDFKLKSIIGALNKLGKIDLHLPEGCSNGMESIELAKLYYKSKDEDICNCLKEYNEYDCKALYLIRNTI